MHEDCQNIYRKARENAKMTRLEASLFLNVSDSTLKNYEKGLTTPDDKTVIKMSKIYKAKWVRYEHIRNLSPIARELFPPLKTEDLAQNVLMYKSKANKVISKDSSIVEIACDGEIDKNEEEEWTEIINCIKENVGAEMALIFTR